MSLPVVDVGAVRPADLLAALQRHGAVLAVDARVPPAQGERALADAAAFFALPDAAKQRIALARSPHFRGHSRMHTGRDWREQLHVGRERPAVARAEPWWRLQGPNPWPDDPAFRDRVLAWLDATARAGASLLTVIAAAFGLDGARWLGADPYVLLKLIGYHPQPAGERRHGVAAHLDFSLLTLTLQDDVGGLELRQPDGTWSAVPPARGAWLVFPGELLQYVTGNRLVATPHRVVNPSSTRTRCSLPLFLAPSLDTVLACELPLRPPPAPGGGHVHAVLDPAVPPPALAFGAAEWGRKGENGWCAVCAPRPGAQGRARSSARR